MLPTLLPTLLPPLLAHGLRVLAVPTAESAKRDAARLIVRQAIRGEFARIMALEEASVALISAPGEPLRLAPPWQHVGVSVSHEPGLSLVAINLAGPVGIDLMRIGEPLADIDMLAHDYLGPREALALAALPAARRQAAFARGWTRLEARLKCLALPLREWTRELDACLALCTVTDLAMPAGWVAALAVNRSGD